jgi:hypothetical protein
MAEMTRLIAPPRHLACADSTICSWLGFGSLLEAIPMQSCIQEMTNVAELVSLSCIQTREQPRRYFDPEKLEQLVQSIDQHGILEPLLVRPKNCQ